MDHPPDRPSAARTGNLPVSDEAAVTLTVNNREEVTLLCTPRDLRELAVGWLYAEGLIDSPDDVLSLVGCAHDREMLIETAKEGAGEEDHWRLITSGCGSGPSAGLLRTEQIPRVTAKARFGLEDLKRGTRAMFGAALIYRETGGVHSAALLSPSGLVVQREDIGRHNAVDKVIGNALTNGLEFGRLALVATGRLSSEMVWKAARAGIPLAASISIPSNLALSIAEAAGMAVIGRVMAAKPLVYLGGTALAVETE